MVRGRTGRSASWGEGLPPELDVQGPGLVAAVDGELHRLAGLLVGDHRAELVDRRDGDAVDLDDEVSAERPRVACERHLLRRAAQVYGEGFIISAGFGVMVEIITKLSWLGARVAEIPLRLRYDLKTSPSRMRLWHTALEYLGLLWRMRQMKDHVLESTRR